MCPPLSEAPPPSPRPHPRGHPTWPGQVPGSARVLPTLSGQPTQTQGQAFPTPRCVRGMPSCPLCSSHPRTCRNVVSTPASRPPSVLSGVPAGGPARGLRSLAASAALCPRLVGSRRHVRACLTTTSQKENDRIGEDTRFRCHLPRPRGPCQGPAPGAHREGAQDRLPRGTAMPPPTRRPRFCAWGAVSVPRAIFKGLCLLAVLKTVHGLGLCGAGLFFLILVFRSCLRQHSGPHAGV